MESIAIVGPGATGTVLAASLLKAGQRVRILARGPTEAARIRREGLRLGGRRLRRFDGVSHRGRDLSPCNGIFFCVKSYDTVAAIRSARPLVSPTSAVLSIQNGLDHVRLLRHAFGPRTVFGAAYFGALREKDGVRYLGGDRIDLGASRVNASAARQVQGPLLRAGWKVRILPYPDRLLWTKLLLNAAINPLGALARCTNGGILDRPALKDLMLRALREGEAVCRRRGIRPLVRRLDLKALLVLKGTRANVNSMAQDLEENRSTEADSILGPILRHTDDPQREAPILYGLYRFVVGLEQT